MTPDHLGWLFWGQVFWIWFLLYPVLLFGYGLLPVASGDVGLCLSPPARCRLLDSNSIVVTSASFFLLLCLLPAPELHLNHERQSSVGTPRPEPAVLMSEGMPDRMPVQMRDRVPVSSCQIQIECHKIPRTYTR